MSLVCCLIYKVLFALTIAHRDSLFSISHYLKFVKHFFQLFSKSFFVLAALATAYISYHITSALSIPFFNFFQIFFKIFPFDFTVSYIASSATARLYYHTIPSLSSTFAQFFTLFLFILTCPHVSTTFPQTYTQFVVDLSCFLLCVLFSRREQAPALLICF